VDYSGDSRLHQFDQYAFSCVDQSYHYLSTCSNNEAQLQYAGDSDSRQVLSHYDYVLSATKYAGTADLARRTSRPRYQRDVLNWMFRPDLFQAIQAKFGPFTIDACCDSAAGANAQLPEYWSDPPGAPEYWSAPPGVSCSRRVASGNTGPTSPSTATQTSTRLMTCFATTSLATTERQPRPVHCALFILPTVHLARLDRNTLV
jgi:hypothetical protein